MTSRTQSNSHKGFWKRERAGGEQRPRIMNQTCITKNLNVNAKNLEFERSCPKDSSYIEECLFNYVLHKQLSRLRNLKGRF